MYNIYSYLQMTCALRLYDNLVDIHIFMHTAMRPFIESQRHVYNSLWNDDDMITSLCYIHMAMGRNPPRPVCHRNIELDLHPRSSIVSYEVVRSKLDQLSSYFDYSGINTVLQSALREWGVQ